MQDESYEQIDGPEAGQPVEPEPGDKKKKKEVPSLREQIHQLRYFFLLLILGGLGYGAYYLYDYMYVAPFEIRDQHGKLYNITFEDKPTVFMVVAGEQSDLFSWIGRLLPLQTKGEVNGHGFMSFAGNAQAIRFEGVARQQVRERAGPQPILLDFEGTATRELRPIPDVLNVIVVGPGGRIRAHITGAWSEENWAKFEAATGISSE